MESVSTFAAQYDETAIQFEMVAADSHAGLDPVRDLGSIRRTISPASGRHGEAELAGGVERLG